MLAPARLRGFSLIETLIVLSIVAILFGAALPQFDRMLARNRAAAAHNGLLAMIAYARNSAIVANAVVVVCPSRDGSGCRGDGVWERGWIAFVDRDGDGVPGARDDLLRHEVDPGHGLRVRTSASRSQLRFMRNGMAGGSNLTLRICDDGGTPVHAVIVSNTGRTRNARAEELAALPACA